MSKRYFFKIAFTFFLLNKTPVSLASSPECDAATDLLFQAYYLYHQDKAVSLQKLLFAKSLRLCPDRPYVQTTFASILENQGQYAQAAFHYEQAIRYDKQFHQAWYGLGETFYKQGRFPLSLEAYASVCQVKEHSKTRMEELLTDNRYAIAKRNEFVDQDSLLVFYQPQRRQHLNQLIDKCGFSHEVSPVYTFINFDFLVSEATISEKDEQLFELAVSQRDNEQLDEIAAALKQLNSPIITIYGHSDSRGFNNLPPRGTNQSLNQRLSEQRAIVVGEALLQRGIPKASIETIGMSDKKLLYPYASQLIANRRVEIQVKYPIELEEEVDK